MTDMVERWRLDEANVRIAAYAKLAGDIRYVCTGSQFSSGGSKVEVLRLLDEFFSGGAASPGGPVQGVALPARPGSVSSGAGLGTPDDWPDYAVDHEPPAGHLVQPPPVSDPATYMGVADYCSAKRLAWL